MESHIGNATSGRSRVRLCLLATVTFLLLGTSQLNAQYEWGRRRVITRNELLEKVWNRSGRLTTRAPDQFIRRLRKIIEENPSEPRYLLTVRDAGYRFVSNPT